MFVKYHTSVSQWRDFFSLGKDIFRAKRTSDQSFFYSSWFWQ